MQEYCAASLNILLILAPFTHISEMHPHASRLKSQKTLCSSGIFIFLYLKDFRKELE